MPNDNGLNHSVRKDALRRPSDSFNDLEHLVVATFEFYKKIHRVVTPYNSRQIANPQYIPPTRELFLGSIKMPSDLIQSEMFSRMINATIEFNLKHKGKRQLVEPHPAVLHSVQFQSKFFKLSEVTSPHKVLPTLNKQFRPGQVRNLVRLEISDHGIVSPIYFENLKVEKYEYLILRPKIGKTGAPVVHYWEALFFKDRHSYIIDHTDSCINPRYVGII